MVHLVLSVRDVGWAVFGALHFDKGNAAVPDADQVREASEHPIAFEGTDLTVASAFVSGEMPPIRTVMGDDVRELPAYHRQD
jgi:hypothetical protein